MSEAKTGFTRGFFGCFGVLAAIVFVIIAFAALSHCAAVMPANDERADSGGRDFNRLTYAGHCANALAEAGGKGQINADRSAVVVPWSIVKVGGTDALPVLECAVTEGDRVRFVTVEVVCEDDSAEECSALRGVSDARTVR